jgi:hypothetical protein
MSSKRETQHLAVAYSEHGGPVTDLPSNWIVFGGFAIDALQPGNYQVRTVVSLDGKRVGA